MTSHERRGVLPLPSPEPPLANTSRPNSINRRTTRGPGSVRRGPTRSSVVGPGPAWSAGKTTRLVRLDAPGTTAGHYCADRRVPRGEMSRPTEIGTQTGGESGKDSREVPRRESCRCEQAVTVQTYRDHQRPPPSTSKCQQHRPHCLPISSSRVKKKIELKNTIKTQ